MAFAPFVNLDIFEVIFDPGEMARLVEALRFSGKGLMGIWRFSVELSPASQY